MLKEECEFELEDYERELAQTELKRAQYQSALLQCQDVLQSVVALSGQEQCRNALLQCRDLLQSTVMLSEQEPLVNLQSGTMESSIEEAGNDDRSFGSDSSVVSTLSESGSSESTKVSVRVYYEKFAELEAKQAK